MKASIMITCLGEMFFPEVGVAMVKLLRRLGVTVDFPPGQTCCGMPLFNSGYHHDAALVAARTVKLFAQAEHVVVPSGSCAWMVKTEYPGLLKDDPALRTQAEALARKTHELSQFLVEVLGVTTVASPFQGRVTYHDSCHLLRELHVEEEPRRLLRAVRGIELLEMQDYKLCCGFGGTFSVKFPEVSVAMGLDKMQAAQQAGAEYLVANDAGCLMHLAGLIHRQRSPLKTLHLAELLAHR